MLIHPLCSLSLDVRVPPLVNTRGIPRSASDQDEVPEGGYKEPHRSLTLLSALGHPGGRMSTWQPVLTSASVSQRKWGPGKGGVASGEQREEAQLLQGFNLRTLRDD